jgi:hypothetical protein
MAPCHCRPFWKRIALVATLPLSLTIVNDGDASAAIEI